MTIYLGTQGWSYKDWVGTFYPPGTQPRDYLKQYSSIFDAVELDTTFYATPPIERVRTWDEVTPQHFQFTAKLPRLVTHDKRLIDTQGDVEEFVSVMSLLGSKLGAILIQLPPDLTSEDRKTVERFVAELPKQYPFAMEFRHRSWLTDETYDLLREHNIAWTMIDLAYMPRHVEITADIAYVRWLGDRRDIERMHSVQIDRRDRLDQWAEVLDDVSHRVQRVYGFANNHFSGHSPADIRHLHARLGLVPQKQLPQQGTLL